jgi:hypothetical protein
LASNASGGAIDAATGAYTAGAHAGVTDVAAVVDSIGNTAKVSIVVGPSLTISPTNAIATVGQTLTFTATGGSGNGYHWSLPTDGSGGSIDVANGAYKAGTLNGLDVVRVIDSLGNAAEATITVSGSTAGGDTVSGNAPHGVRTGCGCAIGGVDDDTGLTRMAALVVLLFALCLRRPLRSWSARTAFDADGGSARDSDNTTNELTAPNRRRSLASRPGFKCAIARASKPRSYESPFRGRNKLAARGPIE